MEKKASYLASLLLCLVVFACMPLLANAATMSVAPQSGTYTVGERAVIRITVSGETPLNAVTGTLAFPTSLFSIESISKSGSVLNFWIAEPSFSNQTGIVQFEGVALSGFQGGSGTVLTIYLKAIKTGSGTVTFKAGQVLANDGQGTDITSGLQGGVYVVEPAPAKPKVEIEPVKPAPEPIIEVPKSNLNSPQIFIGEQDGLTAIRGNSRHAKTDVILTFVSSGGSKVFITGTSDTDGNFSLIVPQALKNGPYSVTAIMVLPDGSRSAPSNTLTIEVGGVFYGDITWEKSTYGALLLACILILCLFYLILKRRRGSAGATKAALKKEVAEAKSVLQKSFSLIKEDVDSLNSSGDVKDLSQSERKAHALIKKDLDAAQKIIEKEIDDIRSIPIDESK